MSKFLRTLQKRQLTSRKKQILTFPSLSHVISALGAASGSHDIVALPPSVANTCPNMGCLENVGANSTIQVSYDIKIHVGLIT